MTASPQRLMQCTMCAYNQAGQPSDPPNCPQHPDRYLVAQKFLVNGPKDYLLGAVLGQKYIITHPLGQGQYGKVYYALQIGAGGLRKPVALKILREDRAEAQALFLDEMKVISQLTSRHIVRYLDSGYDMEQGLTYMVMEVIEGETLSQRLSESGIMNQHRVTRMISQLLIALEEAHQAGVIHRDLKPSNLMLSYLDGEEVLKVLDFGVARPNADQPREQTQGVIPGTPAYMAPELFSIYDGQITPQMDLFSVGIIFYQCLTGYLPFNIEGNVDHLIAYYKLYSLSPKPIPVGNHLHLPKGLIDVVMKSISLDPKKRYNNAHEMLSALAPWSPTAHKHVDTQSALARIDSPSQSTPTVPTKLNWLVAAAILGGVLGLGAHLIYGKGSTQVIGKLLGEMDQATIEQSEEGGSTPEPDGAKSPNTLEAQIPK